MVLTESNLKLRKGSNAPDFKLKGTDNRFCSLKDFKDYKAILIVFMCNHCPYVKAKLSELNRIAEDFRNKGLVVAGINSNDDVNYPEDSFENMQAWREEGRVKFTYLRDETQKTAKSYGAACTPDTFLLDSSFKLVFHSRIDYPPGLEEAEKHELYEAIDEFLKKGKISIKESPSTGCSIKWK